MSYSNNSWGYYSPQQSTANKVDHIADKIDFAVSMINNNLIAIDETKNELAIISQGNTPPRPEQLKAICSRLDTYQLQIKDGLLKIKELAKEIDLATDSIQNTPSW